MVGDIDSRLGSDAGGSLVGDRDELAKGRAFLERFLKAERRIFAYIFTLLPNRTDAEDILQEVSKLMWEKFDEDDPPRDFANWGCRIAYYRVQEYRRSRRRQRVIFSDEIVARLAMTLAERASTLQIDERREALNCCLGKLGPGDRVLLAERLKEGATVQTAAEGAGRSVDAVYKALARIRKALHDCVARALDAEGRS